MFGFVKAALKAVGRASLGAVETAAPAAATIFAGPVAGNLVSLAIKGIIAAEAKHGPTQAAPAPVPAPTPEAPAPAVPVAPAVDPQAVPVGLAKKLDVMAFLEENEVTIVNAILASTGKSVVNKDRFAAGADKIVEGLVDVMKSIGALPSSTPPTDTLEVKPPVAQPKSADATASQPAPFVGVVHNADAATTAADLLPVLQRLIAQLSGGAA